jgi:hypothetical protein
MADLFKTLLAVTAATTLTVSQALAQVPLAEETHINDSLRAARVGDVIRKTCPTISARMFVVWSKADDLKDYALAQGYTRKEVEAFIDNPDEKTRIKAEAAAYLAAAGAVAGDAESYCKVGRDEIAKKSLIGTLLKSSE